MSVQKGGSLVVARLSFPVWPLFGVAVVLIRCAEDFFFFCDLLSVGLVRSPVIGQEQLTECTARPDRCVKGCTQFCHSARSSASRLLECEGRLLPVHDSCNPAPKAQSRDGLWMTGKITGQSGS